MNKNICCFFGHRTIHKTTELQKKLYDTIEKLIVEYNVDIFLFGSKSEFDDLCHQITSNLKTIYPHIKRIYVRAQFPYISDEYNSYLLKMYEESYYPGKILKAGKSAYIQRNYEMINNSKFCIVYYNKYYTPPKRNAKSSNISDCQSKSGTKIAFDYAVKKQKTIINVFEN